MQLLLFLLELFLLVCFHIAVLHVLQLSIDEHLLTFRCDYSSVRAELTAHHLQILLDDLLLPQELYLRCDFVLPFLHLEVVLLPFLVRSPSWLVALNLVVYYFRDELTILAFSRRRGPFGADSKI